MERHCHFSIGLPHGEVDIYWPRLFNLGHDFPQPFWLGIEADRCTRIQWRLCWFPPINTNRRDATGPLVHMLAGLMPGPIFGVTEPQTFGDVSMKTIQPPHGFVVDELIYGRIEVFKGDVQPIGGLLLELSMPFCLSNGTR